MSSHGPIGGAPIGGGPLDEGLHIAAATIPLGVLGASAEAAISVSATADITFAALSVTVRAMGARVVPPRYVIAAPPRNRVIAGWPS